MLRYKKRRFILILGHGRSGTTLCASLLNMIPDINIAFEYLNREIVGEEFDAGRQDRIEKSLPLSYTGNKIVIHNGLYFENIIKCYKDKSWIFHNRFDELKVIFTKRNPINVIVSEKMKLKNKTTEDISIDILVENYIFAEKMIQELKRFFLKYYVFDFEKIVMCELHRYKLFEFVGEEYLPIFSDTYKGDGEYKYGSIHSSNILFGKFGKYPYSWESEILSAFDAKRFWPWQSFECNLEVENE